MFRFRESNLNFDLLMKSHLTKNFIWTMWIEIKPPFIYENVFKLPKTLFQPRESNLNLHLLMKVHLPNQKPHFNLWI